MFLLNNNRLEDLTKSYVSLFGRDNKNRNHLTKSFRKKVRR